MVIIYKLDFFFFRLRTNILRKGGLKNHFLMAVSLRGGGIKRLATKNNFNFNFFNWISNIHETFVILASSVDCISKAYSQISASYTLNPISI